MEGGRYLPLVALVFLDGKAQAAGFCRSYKKSQDCHHDPMAFVWVECSYFQRDHRDRDAPMISSGALMPSRIRNDLLAARKLQLPSPVALTLSIYVSPLEESDLEGERLLPMKAVATVKPMPGWCCRGHKHLTWSHGKGFVKVGHGEERGEGDLGNCIIVYASFGTSPSFHPNFCNQ